MSDNSSKFGSPAKVPAWVNLALIPLVNLTAAFILSGVVILIVGDNPLTALEVSGIRCVWLCGCYWLHALLYHQLYLHRPRRCHRFPLRPV